jgi:hypothetical protein
MKIPAFIKQLAKVCDTESSRYALGGIKCQSDGQTAQLTATDGRILANVYYTDDEGIPLDVIVGGKQLASLPAAAFKDVRGVSFDGQALRHGGTVVGLESIDGRFPRFEDVFSIHDEPEGYVAVKLDPAFLKTLCELAHGVGGEACKGIVLWVKDAQSCVFGDARSSEGHVARLAIMPLAADAPAGALTYPARPGTELVAVAQTPVHAEAEVAPENAPFTAEPTKATNDETHTAGITFSVPAIE